MPGSPASFLLPFQLLLVLSQIGGDGQGAVRTPEGRGWHQSEYSGDFRGAESTAGHVCPRGVPGGGQEGSRHPRDALLAGGGRPQVAGGAPHPCREAPATGFTPGGGGVWDGQLGTSQPRHRHGLQAARQWDLRAGPRTQVGRGGVGGSPPEPPPGSQGPRHRGGGA